MMKSDVTQITRTRGTGRLLEDLEKLENEKAKKLARLSELKERQSKTFAEIAKLLSDAMSIDSLLKLNGTTSYHKSFEQDGKPFRLSVTRLTKAKDTEDSNEEMEDEPKQVRRKRRSKKS